jgi:hypothetical protein
MSLPRTAVLEDLRSRIRAVSPVVRVDPVGSTGLPGLDAWIGGWPRPGIVEVVGAPGSGRLEVVLPALVGERLRRPVMVVDPERQVHPPGWPRFVQERLVLVHPPRERAGWVAEQAARSGALDAILLLDAPPLGRTGLRVSRAVESGACTLFVVGVASEQELPASIRLHAHGWQGTGGIRLACTRSRGGRTHGERVIRTRWTAGVRPDEAIGSPLRPGAPCAG